MVPTNDGFAWECTKDYDDENCTDGKAFFFLYTLPLWLLMTYIFFSFWVFSEAIGTRVVAATRDRRSVVDHWG